MQKFLFWCYTFVLVQNFLFLCKGFDCCCKQIVMAVTLKDYLDRPMESYCSEILDEWSKMSMRSMF